MLYSGNINCNTDPYSMENRGIHVHRPYIVTVFSIIIYIKKTLDTEVLGKCTSYGGMFSHGRISCTLQQSKDLLQFERNTWWWGIALAHLPATSCCRAPHNATCAMNSKRFSLRASNPSRCVPDLPPTPISISCHPTF